ncbi:hypothetical protein JNW90_34865 [Micromonospora sp. STR1s_5]|nr:hypothetical protein [Micromonospora sp. STR1s_5]
MNTRTMFVAAAGLSGLLFAAPALANGSGYGGGNDQGGGGNGYMCGGKDGNGCSVSPVTYKSCSKDLKGDLKELKCDTFDLIREIFKGRDITDELNEVKGDINEIQFDLDVLKGLKKK